MGDHRGAQGYLEQALEINERFLGEEHPDTATSLNNLGMLLKTTGDCTGARTCLERALDVYRRTLGDEHPTTATGLNNLAGLHQDAGDYVLARPYYEEILHIRCRVSGDDHPDTMTSRDNLGALLVVIGDYAAARLHAEHGVEVCHQVLGNNHPEMGSRLNDLGLLLRISGDYPGACQHLERAFEIRTRILGDAHPDTIATLDDLGQVLNSAGDFTKARRYSELALESCLRVFGDDHPQTAFAHRNLGTLLTSMGEFTEAKVHLDRALDIQRRISGEDHLLTANSHNCLGQLFAITGEYAAATLHWERALEINRRELGDSDIETATNLSNLGSLHYAVMDYISARKCLEQALDVFCSLRGDDHPATVKVVSNLGILLSTMGNYSTARPYYERALETNRRILGDDHPDTARCLANLGALLASIGDESGARAHLEQALEAYRRILGADHPSTASTLSNLGMLLNRQGDHLGALEYHEVALRIRRRSLGEVHPETSANFSTLGRLYIATGRIDDGWNQIKQAVAGEDRMLSQLFSISSERVRADFIRSMRATGDIVLSVVFRHLAHMSDSVPVALDLILRRKRIGEEALVVARGAALSGRYPLLEGKVRELSRLREQIAQFALVAPGPGYEAWDAHDTTIIEWETRRDRLEAVLARQIPEMNLERKLRAADRRAVALALDAGVALVEFVRFDEFDFHAVPARGEPHWKPARYLAFVLPAGEPDAVRLIDLGEADPIDRMIADFRASVDSPPEDLDRAATRDMVRRGERRAAAVSGAELRAAVFDPLVPVLEGRTRLIMSPDGQLARLPFAILPTADGRLLADAYQTSYVGTGRDVLRFGADLTTRSTAAFVVCDPDFDLGSAEGIAENQDERKVGRTSRDMHAGMSGMRRLPGTLAEGRAVGDLLGVDPWHGDRAAKKSLLAACRSPRLLHLATHGFFLKDQDAHLDRELWGRFLAALGQLRADVGENPLLRSGLALAGANTFLRGETPPEDADNGLLTALDVSGMDLLGTELVVLSACQTGEGDVQVGEGVIGLQRGFTIAGARTLVMSLWSVDDEATRALMIGFYRRLLAGEGKAEALRLSQEELRARPGYSDPYFWGAFICQGDPGPLRDHCKRPVRG